MPPAKILAPRTLGVLRVAAASGLAIDAARAYIVGDDCTRLHVYDLHTLAELGQRPLLPDTLPDEPRARKAAKPDLESLTWLPRAGLLALGSGSTPRRCRGVLLRDPNDAAAPAVLDLGPLYAALAAEIGDLNLEGAAVDRDALCLFQRGNGAGAVNAVIALDLAGVAAALSTGRAWTAELLRGLWRLDVGALRGGPLGFTDAAPLLDTGDLLFSAVVEGGGSTYEDGDFRGAALGRLSRRGGAPEILWLRELPGAPKIEGVAVRARPGGGARALLVADADDPAVPSPMLAVDLPSALVR